MEKEYKVRLDSDKLNGMKRRFQSRTYNDVVKRSLDFTLEHYDRGIKNKAMEIIDLTITNTIRTEIEPVFQYIEHSKGLQKMSRKNHGIILKSLEELKYQK